MNEPYYPVKKPSGCWKMSGCLLTVGSILMIVLFVCMIFESEEKMDENRAEYAASEEEYEQAMKEYEADSANLHAQYQRIQAEIEAADGDSARIAILQDSLDYYDMPEWKPRGHIGFNIGGAFFLAFALAMLIPLGIGLLLLLYHRNKYRKWRNSPDGPNPQK